MNIHVGKTMIQTNKQSCWRHPESSTTYQSVLNVQAKHYCGQKKETQLEIRYCIQKINERLRQLKNPEGRGVQGNS